MMKRTRGIIAIFLLLAMLLTACGQSAQTPTVVDEPENTTPVVVQPEQEDTAAEPLVFSDQPANVFRAKFEGSNVAGKGEAVDGVYRFTATKTDGEAWHVKLESNYMTVPGRDYRVTYHFKSDVAGTVKFGDFHEFAIRKGENTVTGQVSASNGYTYLDLQLGALKPFTIDFTSIEVEELETEADYESVMTVPIAWSSEGAVYVQHDPGYFYKLDRHLDGVTMKVEEIPFSAEVWMSRLYVKTAAILAPGALYRVSADVSATHEMDMEVCFNNGDNEKGYGAFYGQRMGDMSKRTFQQLIDLRSPGSEGGEVVLQFAFGKSPDGSQVTVDNIRVEKVYEHYTNMLPAYFAMNGSVDLGTEYVMVPTNYTAIPLEKFSFDGTDSVYTGTNPGFAMSLVETASSATAAMIEKTDEDEVWTGRVYVKTGVTPEAGAKYRVSATVHTDAAFDYELIYTNGSDDREYVGLRGASLGENETKTVTTDFTAPADGCQELVLRLAIGKSPLHNKVTISDVQVQKVSKQPAVLTTVSAPAMLGQVQEGSYVAQTVTLGTQGIFWDGSVGNHEVTNGAAKLYIDTARGSNGGIWSVRLHAGTGVTLEAGEKYRISAKIASEKAIHAEVLLSNGYDEDNVFNPGGQGYSTDVAGFDIAENGEATYTKEITVPERSEHRELVLRVQVGNSPANTVTVSDVTVEKWTEPAAEPAAEYVAQTVTLGTQGIFWDGSVGNHEVTNGAAKLYIDTARGSNGGIWSVRLHAGTGVTLEAGEKYRISAKIASEKAIHAEVLLSNGYDEDNDFNPGGQGYSTDVVGFDIAENGEATYTKEITVPQRSQYKELVLRVQVGNSPANTVTVSDVTVEKWVASATDTPAPAAEVLGDNLTADLQYDSVGSFSFNADEGYVTHLEKRADSVMYAISQAPDGRNPWNVKLNVRTGVFPKSGVGYRVKFDIEATQNQQLFEVFYDGNREAGYGQLFDQRLKAGQKKTVSYIVNGNSGMGELVIQIRLGKTDGKSGNIYTISNVTMEEVKFGYAPNQITRSTSELWTHEDYAGTLSTTAASATVRMTTVPAQGKEAWKTKLFVETGAKLQAGQKYRITFTTSGSEGMPYEICLNHGGEEKGLGGIFGLNAMAEGDTITYVTAPDKDIDLVLQFSLGNAWTGGSFTVRDIKVEKAGASSTVSNVTYTF